MKKKKERKKTNSFKLCNIIKRVNFLAVDHSRND